MRLPLSSLLGIILLALAMTNPTTDGYMRWAKAEIARSAGNHPIFALLANAFGDPILQATTQRRSFVVFSIFETQLDQEHRASTLGLADNFIPLPLPKELWRPGAASPNVPHVIAAATPNTWQPEDGYVWITQPPKGDLRVRWQPGQASYKFQHIVAANDEGKWLPADGYGWDQSPPPPGDLKVHWNPGQRSTLHEHVVTAPPEQRWIPEQGFSWIDNPPTPGDFRVRLSAMNGASDLPRLRDTTLRRCDSRDHFMPESPCWFSTDTGMYVASKLGNMRSSTFAHWPNVDYELSGAGMSRPLSSVLTKGREQLGATLAKCSKEADGRGLSVETGFADARRIFRRECMSRMGVEPLTR